MKPERTFIAERALAQHCPELLVEERGDGLASQTLAAFARIAAAMARTLPAALAPLTAGEAPAVTASAPEKTNFTALASQPVPLSAHSLLDIGSQGARMLVSIDGTAVLRSVDRTFGGKGEAPSPLPDAFTPSVGLMVRRMTGLVCTALTQALAFGEGEAVRTLRSDSRLSDLEAFAADTQLATVDLTVEEPGQAQWTIRLATPVSTLAALCAEPADSQRPVGPADPAAQPWCDLPLTVSAVLVEMRLPVSALAGLCPDALLPVSVARQVPLRIAGTRFAHGTIGSLDDCVAIQITQAF